MSLCITFLAHVLDWDFPKHFLHFFSFGLAKILSDTVHGLFPQHQCSKHTIWENTDQCCPYGNSTPGHSAMKMSLFRSSLFTSVIVGMFEKISKKYTFPRFLPFNLLPKNFISSDLQWLAKLVLAVQLWSLHKISDQKKRFVEGEWWTVRSVWSHGYCACLWISRSLGTSPGWGHCCVLGHNTLLSQCLSLYPGVLLANLMLGITLQWTSIPSRGSRILLVSSWHRNQGKIDHLVPLQILPTYIGELIAINIYLKEMLPFFNTHAFVMSIQFLECL